MDFNDKYLSLLEANIKKQKTNQKYNLKEITSEVNKSIYNINLTDKKVAITVGSRGITNISSIIKILVNFFKEKGAIPFIVPAMGSHGGNSKEGKIEVLASLGVTEKSINAPINANIETIQIGNTATGKPVHCLESALAADFVIIVNRIKNHTDFHGEIGSGLIKMAAVGLGGEAGAKTVHSEGYSNLCKYVKEIGLKKLSLLPVLFGVAIIEDFYGNLFHLEIVKPGQFLQKEKTLYKKAREFQPTLPVSKLDLLVVINFGKEISGSGMDPNVTGRYPSGETVSPDAKRIVVLRLTPQSHGNASGIGLADIITTKFYNAIDLNVFYKNQLACNGFLSGKIPIIMPSDYRAIECAINSLNQKSNIKLMIIDNTSSLEKIRISSSLKEEVRENGYTISDKSVKYTFDGEGNIKNL